MNAPTAHRPIRMSIYNINWTAHVRGRAGYATGKWLFFAAGGLAVADATVHEELPAEGGKYFGWSIGGGVDYAFTRNLIGRVEYLYDDFGHRDSPSVASHIVSS
jgi:outer membrane immunogenic protein